MWLSIPGECDLDCQMLDVSPPTAPQAEEEDSKSCVKLQALEAPCEEDLVLCCAPESAKARLSSSSSATQALAYTAAEEDMLVSRAERVRCLVETFHSLGVATFPHAPVSDPSTPLDRRSCSSHTHAV
jgi:hypothetical protein